MPPGKHVLGEGLQRRADLPRPVAPLAHGLHGPQQMCPTPLTPAYGIPAVATPAVRHHKAIKGLAHKLPCHLAAARTAHHNDRHPRPHSTPQPGPRVALAPAGLIERHGRRLWHRGPGLGDRLSKGARPCLREVGGGPDAHHQPEHICQQPLCQAVRETIGPRTHGDCGLHAWPIGEARPPSGQAARVRSPQAGQTN